MADWRSCESRLRRSSRGKLGFLHPSSPASGCKSALAPPRPACRGPQSCGRRVTRGGDPEPAVFDCVVPFRPVGNRSLAQRSRRAAWRSTGRHRPRGSTGGAGWPLERFVAAASALGRMHGVRIVLMGASADDMMSARFRAAVGDKLVDLLGKTRVRQLGALLRRVNLLIANDSAPIQIAAAVGTPVLAL